MPIGKQHKKQKAKNYLTFAILIMLMGLFFIITLIKVHP